MIEVPSPRPPAPKHVALATIAALASGVGLLPYFRFVDRSEWLLSVVLVSPVWCFYLLRRQTAKVTTETTTKPSLGEWLLGAWSAVGEPVASSLLGMALFGLFYAGVQLFNWAAHHLGFAAQAAPGIWGFWGSIWWIVAGGCVGGPIRGARELFRQLYPHDAGARSPFFPLLARTKLLVLIGVAVAVALALMLWLLDVHGAAFSVLASLTLFYGSYPLTKMGRAAVDGTHRRVVEALAALLHEAGYSIVRRPRTGKAEIDPLLKSVDLLAKTGERAFAVGVTTVESQTPVEWNEASAVRTAAQLLSDGVLPDSDASVTVEPVLMVVGGTVTQSLAAFSQRERVPVVHFEGVAEAINNRRELAGRLQAAGLVFPLAPAASAVSA